MREWGAVCWEVANILLNKYEILLQRMRTCSSRLVLGADEKPSFYAGPVA